MQSKTLKIAGILLCVVLVGVLCYFFLPTLLAALAPFIIAYILSLALEPLIRLLNEKLRIPRAIAACISTILAIGIIGGLLTWLVFALWAQIVELAAKWPELYAAGRDYVFSLSSGLQGFYEKLSPEVQAYVNAGVLEIRDSLTKLISPVANWLVYLARGIVAGIPSTIIFVIVTFLACNFMCAEKKKLRSLLSRIFGAQAIGRTLSVWHDLKSALGGYIKTQLSIMSVSAVILFIGFSIGEIPFALLLAITVAVFDALPVFGSGAILLPWSLVALLQGDYMTMAVMLVMYITIIITRQILEPRILGKHIGVPPLLTLMSMYIGLKFIGIFGMLLGPVLVLVVKNLYIGGVFDRLLKNDVAEQETIKTESENTPGNQPEEEVADHE